MNANNQVKISIKIIERTKSRLEVMPPRTMPSVLFGGQARYNRIVENNDAREYVAKEGFELACAALPVWAASQAKQFENDVNGFEAALNNLSSLIDQIDWSQKYANSQSDITPPPVLSERLEEMNMNVQRTYLNKTAGQWLGQSEICESRAGRREIFVARDVIARYHPDGLLLETAGGPLAVLEMGPLMNERFCELCELRDENKDA